ncbi:MULTISPECIES: sulfur carrier protein ThiS [unclassified Frankia]|uniref:sulfur carrier protein ThiS n=1 Tax=unclassified Frankia TaxID=2632575 RepID=UPI002AD3E0F6|nr:MULTISPECIES: sulfur carrier protein ThiS [unclassified Frankia]
MTLTVNGEAMQVPAGTTLHQLIADLAGAGRGTAAAVDGVVAPRSRWAELELRAGQHVEILTATQGG